MLVLTRKEGEKVVIGGRITVTVLEVRGGRVKLGFSAPVDVTVNRAEVEVEAGAARLADRLTNKRAGRQLELAR